MAVGKLPRRDRASCRPPGTNAALGFRDTPEGSVRPDASSRPAGGAQLHSGKCAGRVLCVSTKGPEWSYFYPCKDSKSPGIMPRKAGLGNWGSFRDERLPSPMEQSHELLSQPMSAPDDFSCTPALPGRMAVRTLRLETTSCRSSCRHLSLMPTVREIPTRGAYQCDSRPDYAILKSSGETRNWGRVRSRITPERARTSR